MENKDKNIMESIADTVKGAVGDVQPVNLFPHTAHCECVNIDMRR